MLSFFAIISRLRYSKLRGIKIVRQLFRFKSGVISVDGRRENRNCSFDVVAMKNARVGQAGLCETPVQGMQDHLNTRAGRVGPFKKPVRGVRDHSKCTCRECRTINTTLVKRVELLFVLFCSSSVN